MTFTKKFVYLGSTLSSSLTSAHDVTARLAKAAAIFGALRKCVFTSADITPKTKAKVYRGLVLSVLLYGSECWALRVADERRLICFHNRCVRVMTRISKHKQWKRHITGEELEERCGVQSMEFYLRRRVLRWVGHIVRMEQHRLPRKLLFGWVPHPRKRGRPHLTFGHRIGRLIKVITGAKTGIALVEEDLLSDLTDIGKSIGWVQVAKDRDKWREVINAGLRQDDKKT